MPHVRAGVATEVQICDNVRWWCGDGGGVEQRGGAWVYICDSVRWYSVEQRGGAWVRICHSVRWCRTSWSSVEVRAWV